MINKFSILAGPNSLKNAGLFVQQFMKMSSTTPHTMIKVERVGVNNHVGLITFNRPKELNVLCKQLRSEVDETLAEFQEDNLIRAVVITGSETVFAAGADIKEFIGPSFADVYSGAFPTKLTKISEFRKPIIAAVNGFALGGGCEVAMMCDIIYAGKKAQFSLPETTIGTIPGAGGSQRMPRAVGKSKAMELCFTGNRMSAEEALQRGLVSKIYPIKEVVQKAIELGDKIAEQSPLMISMIKETINQAYETSLHDGLSFERRLFHTTFSTNDRKEGMSAFAGKRKPQWTAT